MKINFSNYRENKDQNPWLNELAKEFRIEHDIVNNTKIRIWFRSRQGSKCFIDWLKNKGWEVSYWELPPIIEDEEETYLAYGIEIKENCPEFIAYKLKM